MNDGGGCDGHSHDHMDNSDDLGLSLYQYIDIDGITCLNEVVVDSGRSVFKAYDERNTSQPSVQSPADDPELLFHIPFTEAVTMKSISISCCNDDNDDNNNNDEPTTAPPRRIRLFTNREAHDIDFDTAREASAPRPGGFVQQEIELLPPIHFVEGTIDYPCRPAGRFQNISSLTIYVADNYHDDAANNNNDNNDNDEVLGSTKITYIGFKGKGTSIRCKPVHAVYESQAMPDDHKKVHGNTQNASHGIS